MSLTKPNKMDDLGYQMWIYKEFLCDPKLRTNKFAVKYFLSKMEKCIKILKKLENVK